MNIPQGAYYYPNPKNKKERMYVRDNEGTIEFRLWHQEHPQVWEKHGWLDMDIIKRAAGIYDNSGQNPLELYDISVARALLKNR
ncbi:MAG: hypothetical protein R6X11_09720 [Desulfonatronovibrio sp.]